MTNTENSLDNYTTPSAVLSTDPTAWVCFFQLTSAGRQILRTRFFFLSDDRFTSMLSNKRVALDSQIYYKLSIVEMLDWFGNQCNGDKSQIFSKLWMQQLD